MVGALRAPIRVMFVKCGQSVFVLVFVNSVLGTWAELIDELAVYNIMAEWYADLLN
jgi:hypothetical protein